MSQFVHLRLHTEYSLVDSVIRIKPLMGAVKAMEMPAVALTDQSNLFAMVKFYKTAMANGIKPIIGSDVWIRYAGNQPASRMVLLCQNDEGYKNLTRLVSRSFTEGQHQGVAYIERNWMTAESCKGIIALSGGREGDIGRSLLSGNIMQAEQLLCEWASLFKDRFYLELQRTGRQGEEDYIHSCVGLALQCNVPVVATNDVRFLKPEEFQVHEARICIKDGRTLDDPRRPRLYSEQQYLRSGEEMEELFRDIPEAVENTWHIAQRCNIFPQLGTYFLPQCPIPGGMSEADYICEASRQGLEQRLAIILDRSAPDYEIERARYVERLEIELDVINKMGFPGYFLIVADFIQWAKDNDIPVGPGRGSGAGSLVAYALKITDLDPLQYELLFERFLNPERISMPDFDVDFCMEGRDRVIDYVARTYGRNQVSQIITYGSMAAKAVIRDVGRVLGHPYGFVDRIAKLIPPDLGMTLSKALEQEEQLKNLYTNDEEVTAMMDLAMALEGLTRNVGKHAGGVVIAPDDLTEFSPLYCEEGGGGLVTQFDKDDVEAIGLVKFDFLGLRTLTIIDWAVKAANDLLAAEGKPAIDINRIPLDDSKTFDLLKRADTTAVFQLESQGMKGLIKRLLPDNFEDIIALVALFRPGPLDSGMVDDFINRKHGRAEVAYPHPDYQHELLKPILEPTYGVIVYQEQVMQIAQVLAGYTLGGADMLRRAMGKKKPEEMAKQRSTFAEGAAKQGIDPDLAMNIFDLVEKFAGYGFNKSHSAAYALVSYQTAWLKAYFPAPFMAAVLSSDMDNTDKVVNFIQDCYQSKLEILPPNVNHSEYKFTAVDRRTIRYGLGAIKGVGQGPVDALIEERQQNGRYKDLVDFCCRVDTRKINRRMLESLIRAGALDGLGPNRASMMANLTDALQLADQQSKNQAVGMGDLFGMDTGGSEAAVELREEEEFEDEVLLQGEKETLGLYFSGHPINRYKHELKNFVTSDLGVLTEELAKALGSGSKVGFQKGTQATIAGLLVATKIRRNENDAKEAFVTLDDGTGRADVRIYPEDFDKYAELLVKDQVLVVEGSARFNDRDNMVSMRCKRIFSLDQARSSYARCLQITLSQDVDPREWTRQLRETLEPFREGKCPLEIRLKNGQAQGAVRLGGHWKVTPVEELIKRLNTLAGRDAVAVVY